MKKLIALFVLLSAATVHMLALDFTYEGVNYTVIDEAAKTCMTKPGSSSSPGNKVSGDLVIPKTANNEGVGYSVVKIGEYSFRGNKGITSVAIPKTVTTIGDWAFLQCTGMKSIDIPNSVDSIGFRAFTYCGLKSIVIPNSITVIGYRLFSSCDSLASVEIPNSVTAIDDEAFRGTAITTLKLPNSVKSIRQQAFANCAKLSSVELSNSLDSIASGAFRYCEALTSIDIPASVTYLDEKAFTRCSNLKAINVDENNKEYCSVNGVVWTKDGSSIVIVPDAYSGSLEIPSSATAIADNAFSGREGLTSIIIPNTVTSIGNSAFSGCTGLTSITIPSSVTTIGNEAFSGCTALTSITISSSVTTIGNEVFRGCTALTTITIPNSVTSIGKEAFSGCTSLTTITIPSSVTSIGEGIFIGCEKLTSINLDKDNPAYCLIDGALYNKDVTLLLYVPVASTGSFEIPATVTRIGNYAFRACSKLTNITIPNSVTSIGSGAFQLCVDVSAIALPNSITEIADGTFERCMSLTSISIPNSVASIGYNAFAACHSLASVTLPPSLTLINTAAFYDCFNLTSISFPSSLKTIGFRAFNNCSKLTSLIIPNSVTSIEVRAFDRCNNLTQIECYVSFPPSTEQIFSRSIYDTATLYIPTGTKERYAKADAWKEFKNVEDNLPMIGNVDMTARHETDRIMVIGQQFSWMLNLKPANAVDYVEFSTSNEDIIAIDKIQRANVIGVATAMVSAKSYGSVTLTAKCDNTTVTCGIAVVPYSVTLDCNNADLDVAEQKQLSASLFPARNATIVWASSNTNVAEVSADGLITAKAPGEAVITATCGDRSAYCIVNVPQPDDVPEVKLSIKLALAQKLQLSAIISPENAGDEVVWTSTNPEIVAVADDGTVTAKALGNAVVTATCGERSASCVFNVEESAGDITGIDDVNSEVSNEVVVYNLQGILMDVSTREELKELPAGYYIVDNQVELVK